jgi:hypothetical protein
MPTLLTGCDSPTKDGDAEAPACDPTVAQCTPACKLVSITVTRNATPAGGAKSWAAVKKATDEVIVEATTSPNTEECWKSIRWSGDSGSPGDKSNQRRLSRATSKKLHVEAELGGVKDSLDVWILWATVTILTNDKTPANSAKFGGDADGTENLGAVVYDSIFSREDGTRYQSVSGKVAVFAIITPKGAGQVIQSGWSLKRERWSHDWMDGKKNKEGNTRSSLWNTDWVDDTSLAPNLRLTPDADEKIYDIDGPNVRPGLGQSKSYQSYNNFRQFVHWNGEICSEKAGWYFRARWRESPPNVTYKDLGRGYQPLPDTPL